MSDRNHIDWKTGKLVSMTSAAVSPGGSTVQPIGGQTITTVTPTQPIVWTIMGERFVQDDNQPFGDLIFDSRSAGWLVSAQTYQEIRSRSTGTIQSIVMKVRQARKEGSPVVAGVVQHDPRRAVRSTAKVAAKGDLESLAERSNSLVRQIAELLDAGPIPDGTMAELTKTVAAMQAERDAIADALSVIDANLSLGRGLVIEFSMGV